MMKYKISLLLFFVMVLGLFSMCVSANDNLDKSQASESITADDIAVGMSEIVSPVIEGVMPDELIQDQLNETETTAETPEEPSTDEVEGSAKMQESKMAVSENDADMHCSIVLSEQFSNQIIASLSTTEGVPLILDISVFDAEINSLVIPKELFNVIVGTEPENISSNEITVNNQLEEIVEESELEAANDSVVEDNLNAETTEDLRPISGSIDAATITKNKEVVLKIITKSREYTWKRSSLLNIEVEEDAVMIEFDDADNTHHFNLGVANTEAEHTIVISNEADKNYGMLFISKEHSDGWAVTGEYLFDSGATYIVVIASLVVLLFAVIVAIDLLLINIYKSRK